MLSGLERTTRQLLHHFIFYSDYIQYNSELSQQAFPMLHKSPADISQVTTETSLSHISNSTRCT